MIVFSVSAVPNIRGKITAVYEKIEGVFRSSLSSDRTFIVLQTDHLSKMWSHDLRCGHMIYFVVTWSIYKLQLQIFTDIQ